tara:strand:+ start:5063 stop:5320 length:258 start_codon:yes stop_codon:yes gene_type:complete
MNQQVTYPELKTGKEMEALTKCLLVSGRCCGSKKATEKECENIYKNLVLELKEDKEKLKKIKSSMNCDEVCFMLGDNIIYQTDEP